MAGKKVKPSTQGLPKKGRRRKEKLVNGHLEGLSLSPPSTPRDNPGYANSELDGPVASDGSRNFSHKWGAVTAPLESAAKWKDFVARRRKVSIASKTQYREGPAPREYTKSDKLYDSINSTHRGIGSDLEEDSEQEDSRSGSDANSINGTRLIRHQKAVSQKLSNAGNRALIIYFSKLANGRNEEDEIDLGFVESLLNSGADVNTCDRFGQTILHEVARAWHTDVAAFMLHHGADINKADRYGRTPLHVAAAVDYPKMVKYLVDSGGNIHGRTYEEYQTPIHYAAKNDAVRSLKILIKLGASVHDRDYKDRTPLQIAAELDRSETAKYLVELGVPVGVCDASGLPAMSLMIQKMPPVAKEALGQFHTTERANRKQYYFLNYLEPKLPGQISLAKQPLQCAVEFKQMDLLLHPVMQRLIEVKWRLFGKVGCWKQVIVQLIFVLVWTSVALILPKDGNYYPSRPFKEWWYHVVLEAIALLLTVYYIFQEFWEYRSSSSIHRRWKAWRSSEVKRDLHYCHPRWPEEGKYLEQELENLEQSTISYLKDSWNIFDWITYFWIFAVIITRIVAITGGQGLAKSLHPRVFAIALIFIWLRVMKVMRAFRALGPFIVMISHILADTLKFGFLYFEFFIPYVCAFWILFGGSTNAAKMKAEGQSSKDWENLNDLMYTVWIITVVGDFTFESLTAVDKLMAQLLVGTYIAFSGVVMLNLFIALMSDTFQRVYDNAKANAIMQQASLILSVEQSISQRKRDKFRRYIHSCCNPEEVYYDDDDTHESDELEKMTIQIKEVVDGIDENIKETLMDGQIKQHFDKEIERLRTDTLSTLDQYGRSIDNINLKIEKISVMLEQLMQRDSIELNKRRQALPPPSSLSESFRIQSRSSQENESPRLNTHRRTENIRPSEEFGPSEETRRNYNRRSRMKVSHLVSAAEERDERDTVD